MDGLRTLTVIGCGIGFCLGIIGCAAVDAPNAGRAASVQAGDFADERIVRRSSGSERVNPPIEMISEPGSEAVLVMSGTPEPPGHDATTSSSLLQQSGRPPGRPVVVDVKVGQINGEPIYAGEYLARMEARLRADARRMERDAWLRMTAELIADDLRSYIQDRLLSAEFRQSLPAEQRQGLRFFLEQLRDQQRLMAGGSAQQANQTLLDTEGMTLDEKVRAAAELEFRRAQLHREIISKVHISRRDIEQFYRQNIDEYAPPPVARFRAIVVDARDTDTLHSVEEALRRGENAAALAGQYSLLGGERSLLERPVSREGFSTTTFFEDPDVNKAARSLEVGGCSERVTVRGRVWWLCLEEIEEIEPTPLYKVQGEIESILQNRQLNERMIAYFAELEAKSNLTDRTEMVTRLVTFALERFYLPEQERRVSTSR